MKYAVIFFMVGLNLLGWRMVSAQTVTAIPPDEPPTITPTVEQDTPPLEATLTPEQTLDATLSPTETATFEETINTISPTETMSQTPTENAPPLPTASSTAIPIPSATETSTETPTLAFISVTGQVIYQNRVSGNAQIQVRAFGPDGSLLSSAYTDIQGFYTLMIFANQATRVEIDAPLYVREVVYLVPGTSPIPLVLRAGDLDGDACVGNRDVGILTSQYGQPLPSADLDGSGLVDAVDLALLSANYDTTCEMPPMTEIPTLTATAMVTAESTATEMPTPISTSAETDATPTASDVPPEPTSESTAAAPVDDP